LLEDVMSEKEERPTLRVGLVRIVPIGNERAESLLAYRRIGWMPGGVRTSITCVFRLIDRVFELEQYMTRKTNSCERFEYGFQ
jgi:hypothetical protein